MKKKHGIANLFLFGLFGNQHGDPVSGMNIYLETESGRKLVAFQQTGEAGKITFAHLNKGVYKIYLDMPRQADSPDAKKEQEDNNFKVGYHRKKMICFLQEPQGFYLVKYSDVENLDNSNITPMYEWEQDEITRRLVIAKLEVTGSYGGFTLRLATLSQKKFQKLINKYKHDAGMAIINSESIPPPAK